MALWELWSLVDGNTREAKLGTLAERCLKKEDGLQFLLKNKVEIRSLDNYNFSHVPTQFKESLAQVAAEREDTFLIIDEPGRNGPRQRGT